VRSLGPAERVVVIGAGSGGIDGLPRVDRRRPPPRRHREACQSRPVRAHGDLQGLPLRNGGHRFFTKGREVKRSGAECSGRLGSRRLGSPASNYDRRFFYYPLRPLNALLKLGPFVAAAIASATCGGSSSPIRARIPSTVGDESVRPASLPVFFKTYHGEGLGIPCSELRAEWQRSASRTCR